MQNIKVKYEKKSPKPIPHYPPHYSSRSHEQTKKNEVKERGNQQNFRFLRIHFGECASELHELIPPSPFHLRGTRRRLGFHPYVVDLPTIRTKKFASSFIMRTAKEWNALPADLFPEQYNLGLFKARVNRHFSSNITCPARKAFYVPEERKIHWNTSRVTTSAFSSNSTMATNRARRPVLSLKQEKESELQKTSNLQRRPAKSPSNSCFTTYAGYSVHDSLRTPMVHRNSKMQHPTISAPQIKKVESKEKISKMNWTESDEENILTRHINSASQTKAPLYNHHSFGFGELSFRPKRQEIPPPLVRGHRYSDIFSSAPHLKYGMFGKRKNRAQSRDGLSERPLLRPLSKLPRPPQNEMNRRDIKRRTILNHRDAPSYVINRLDHPQKKQLSISGIMHVDIKPNICRKKSPPVHRQNARFCNRSMTPYANKMPLCGDVSPPYRSRAWSPIRGKGTSQSLRNMTPHRNTSSSFKNTSNLLHLQPNIVMPFYRQKFDY